MQEFVAVAQIREHAIPAMAMKNLQSYLLLLPAWWGNVSAVTSVTVDIIDSCHNWTSAITAQSDLTVSVRKYCSNYQINQKNKYCNP